MVSPIPCCTWRAVALPQLWQHFAAGPHRAHAEQRRREGERGEDAGEEGHGEQHRGKPWLFHQKNMVITSLAMAISGS